MLRNRRFPEVLVIIAIGACQPAQVGSRYVKSEQVSASSGSTLSVAASESGALQGTTLQIGAGALAQDTTISLEVGMTDLVPAASAAGPVAVWEPSGLHFLTPVKMTLPFRLRDGQRAEDLNVVVQEGDGSRARIKRDQLDVDVANGRLSFMVSGFTGFQPNAGAACAADADCASGEACTSGTCTPRGGTGGGSSGAGGGVAGTGGGTQTGTACTNVRDCDPAYEDCVGGYCVPINTGTGGGSGAGGGSSGTGGGTASCTPSSEICDGVDNDCDGNVDDGASCSAGQTCWGGSCTTISCDPVRGCPSGLSCVNNSCQ